MPTATNIKLSSHQLPGSFAVPPLVACPVRHNLWAELTPRPNISARVTEWRRRCLRMLSADRGECFECIVSCHPRLIFVWQRHFLLSLIYSTCGIWAGYSIFLTILEYHFHMYLNQWLPLASSSSTSGSSILHLYVSSHAPDLTSSSSTIILSSPFPDSYRFLLHSDTKGDLNILLYNIHKTIKFINVYFATTNIILLLILISDNAITIVLRQLTND